MEDFFVPQISVYVWNIEENDRDTLVMRFPRKKTLRSRHVIPETNYLNVRYSNVRIGASPYVDYKHVTSNDDRGVPDAVTIKNHLNEIASPEYRVSPNVFWVHFARTEEMSRSERKVVARYAIRYDFSRAKNASFDRMIERLEKDRRNPNVRELLSFDANDRRALIKRARNAKTNPPFERGYGEYVLPMTLEEKIRFFEFVDGLDENGINLFLANEKRKNRDHIEDGDAVLENAKEKKRIFSTRSDYEKEIFLATPCQIGHFVKASVYIAPDVFEAIALPSSNAQYPRTETWFSTWIDALEKKHSVEKSVMDAIKATKFDRDHRWLAWCEAAEKWYERKTTLESIDLIGYYAFPPTISFDDVRDVETTLRVLMNVRHLFYDLSPLYDLYSPSTRVMIESVRLNFASMMTFRRPVFKSFEKIPGTPVSKKPVIFPTEKMTIGLDVGRDDIVDREKTIPFSSEKSFVTVYEDGYFFDLRYDTTSPSSSSSSLSSTRWMIMTRDEKRKETRWRVPIEATSIEVSRRNVSKAETRVLDHRFPIPLNIEKNVVYDNATVTYRIPKNQTTRSNKDEKGASTNDYFTTVVVKNVRVLETTARSVKWIDPSKSYEDESGNGGGRFVCEIITDHYEISGVTPSSTITMCVRDEDDRDGTGENDATSDIAVSFFLRFDQCSTNISNDNDDGRNNNGRSHTMAWDISFPKDGDGLFDGKCVVAERMGVSKLPTLNVESMSLGTLFKYVKFVPSFFRADQNNGDERGDGRFAPTNENEAMLKHAGTRSFAKRNFPTSSIPPDMTSAPKPASSSMVSELTVNLGRWVPEKRLFSTTYANEKGTKPRWNVFRDKPSVWTLSSTLSDPILAFRTSLICFDLTSEILSSPFVRGWTTVILRNGEKPIDSRATENEDLAFSVRIRTPSIEDEPSLEEIRTDKGKATRFDSQRAYIVSSPRITGFLGEVTKMSETQSSSGFDSKSKTIRKTVSTFRCNASIVPMGKGVPTLLVWKLPPFSPNNPTSSFEITFVSPVIITVDTKKYADAVKDLEWWKRIYGTRSNVVERCLLTLNVKMGTMGFNPSDCYVTILPYDEKNTSFVDATATITTTFQQ